ncbi:cell division topological specificity factor MinE [Ferrimonas pelagia]|uniref:Cell division topological specificity factor n=1 Tax=Ferrimonas pelagia TaxID=1177826 RepID=A0ABP9FLT2_9GAMM
MSLLDYFKKDTPSASAQTAKERLQIIVAHERAHRSGPSYLPQLEQDLLAVIGKYVDIEPDQIQIQLDHNDEQLAVLEVNVTLPN